jgi:hypothetical protein
MALKISNNADLAKIRSGNKSGHGQILPSDDLAKIRQTLQELYVPPFFFNP